MKIVLNRILLIALCLAALVIASPPDAPACPPSDRLTLEQVRSLMGEGKLISETNRVQDYEFRVGDRVLQATFIDGVLWKKSWR